MGGDYPHWKILFGRKHFFSEFCSSHDQSDFCLLDIIFSTSKENLSEENPSTYMGEVCTKAYNVH